MAPVKHTVRRRTLVETPAAQVADGTAVRWTRPNGHAVAGRLMGGISGHMARILNADGTVLLPEHATVAVWS